MNPKRGTFRFVAVGDMLASRRLSVYDEPEYLTVIRILREADATFGNFEVSITPSLRNPGIEGYPRAISESVPYSGPCWTGGQYYIPEEMKWAGFNMLAVANNCQGEYGVEGYFATMEGLNRAGIAWAGLGRNLGEARSPGYLDTRKGRVALVAGCTSFHDALCAQEVRPDHPGVPGINGLRTYSTITEELRTRAIEVAKNYPELKAYLPVGDVIEHPILCTYIELGGKKILVRNEMDFEIDTRDLDANMRWLSSGRRMADWAFFSVHYHQTRYPRGGASAKERATKPLPVSTEEERYVPRFIQSLARLAIDNGADGFLGHGPHGPRGVEIYRKKPIFYGLSDFIATHDSTEPQPSWFYDWFGFGPDATPSDVFDRYGAGILDSGIMAENMLGSLREIEDYWWEGIIAVCDFDTNSRDLTALKFVPVWLQKEKRRSQRGRPILADKERGRKIVEALADRSVQFGTKVVYDGERNVGLVEL